jgi:hypothetical protein
MNCLWCGAPTRLVTSNAHGVFLECSGCPARFPSPMPKPTVYVHGRAYGDDDDCVEQYPGLTEEDAVAVFVAEYTEYSKNPDPNLPENDVFIHDTFLAYPVKN